MWSLNIPMKIKLFMWKAAHDLLPTLQNLVKRKVLESDSCDIYKREVKTVSHVLSAASDAWVKSLKSYKQMAKFNHRFMCFMVRFDC